MAPGGERFSTAVPYHMPTTWRLHGDYMGLPGWVAIRSFIWNHRLQAVRRVRMRTADCPPKILAVEPFTRAPAWRPFSRQGSIVVSTRGMSTDGYRPLTVLSYYMAATWRLHALASPAEDLAVRLVLEAKMTLAGPGETLFWHRHGVLHGPRAWAKRGPKLATGWSILQREFGVVLPENGCVYLPI